jgi:hypothetical protein
MFLTLISDRNLGVSVSYELSCHNYDIPQTACTPLPPGNHTRVASEEFKQPLHPVLAQDPMLPKRDGCACTAPTVGYGCLTATSMYFFARGIHAADVDLCKCCGGGIR